MTFLPLPLVMFFVGIFIMRRSKVKQAVLTIFWHLFSVAFYGVGKTIKTLFEEIKRTLDEAEWNWWDFDIKKHFTIIFCFMKNRRKIDDLINVACAKSQNLTTCCALSFHFPFECVCANETVLKAKHFSPKSLLTSVLFSLVCLVFHQSSNRPDVLSTSSFGSFTEVIEEN